MGASGQGSVFSRSPNGSGPRPNNRVAPPRELQADFAVPEKPVLIAQALPPQASPQILLPPDLIPTVIQWSATGIVGFIAILVGSQLANAAQEEFGSR